MYFPCISYSKNDNNCKLLLLQLKLISYAVKITNDSK